MEQTKTIKELLEMPPEEVKEYLLTLPGEERRRISGELLQALIVRDLELGGDNSYKPAPR
jgi:hypothetical protein